MDLRESQKCKPRNLYTQIFFGGACGFQLNQLADSKKKPLVQPARHSRGGSARQISPTVLSSHWNGMNWPYRLGGSLFSDMPRSSQNSYRRVADLSDLVEVVEEGQGCYSALTEEGTDLCFKDFGMGQNLFYYQGKKHVMVQIWYMEFHRSLWVVLNSCPAWPFDFRL